MVEILKQTIPFLIAAIGVLILSILVREAIRYLRRRNVLKKRERCYSLIGNLEHIKADEFSSLVLELKKSFPLPLIEGVLDEYRVQTTDHRPQTTDLRQRLAEIYLQLGILDNHIKTLQEGKSWTERAEAAKKLGEISHSQAVLPLIVVLQDPTEDREVKSVTVRALGGIRDERAIEPLVEALGLPNPATGQPLADVLVQFGDMAVDPLINTLKSSKKEMQRFWAARILGILKANGATHVLLNALSDHSDKVRAEAAISLGHLCAHEGVSILSKILIEDPVGQVRDAAAEALGEIADERSLADLKRALADYDYTTRRKAMEALEKMGEKAYPFFFEGLSDKSKETVAQAAAALERLGVVAKKIEELEGENWQEAFELLTQIAKAGVVETLARSLKNPKLEVRIRLCRVLSEGMSPRTVEALSESARSDTEWAVRLEAMLALVKLADAKSVPVLVQALGGEEETIRERLLAALQDASPSLLEPLASDVGTLLEDGNVKIRVAAVKVIARVHSDFVFSKLISSLADASPEVRKEAALALGNYRPQTTDLRSQTTEALITALRDNDREVRVASVKSLGKLKDPNAIGPLADAFERADEGYRNDIAAALAAMPKQDFYKLNDHLMGLSHPKARAGIAWTLGLIGDEKAIGLLGTFLKDGDPIVRASAVGAIGSFRKKEVAPILIEYLSDPNERVRAAVVNALGKSGDSSVIKNLLPLLEHEPDEFTCQRAVLAIGCLQQTADRRPQTTDNEVIKEIRRWLESRTDPKSKAAGFVGLALLNDRTSFQRILKAVQDDNIRPIIQVFLKEIPKETHDRFFGFLSLDPNLFWRDKAKEGTKHYIHLLESSRDVSDRLNSIEALAALGDKSALPAIEYAFSKDPNSKVRAAALTALGLILDGEKLVAKIIAAVKDPSDEVRMKALPMLNRLSPKELEKSRELLIPLLDSHQEDIRAAASNLLARLYHNNWRFLADQLLGASIKTRILGLIETLGKIGDPAVAPLFVKFMKQGDPDVKMTAVKAAAESGVLTKNEWIPLIDDPHEDIRLAAIKGLGRQLDTEVIELFSLHLDDPSAKIRAEIAKILGKKRLIGEKRPVEMLNKLIRDENPEVRVMSLISLYHMDETSQAAELAKNLGNLEKKDFEEVLNCLDREGIFFELLTTLKSGQSINSRKRAIEYLAAMDLPRFAGEIVHSLKDPASTVRLAAVGVLEKMEDQDIQQAIESLAQDPVEEVRRAVKQRRLRILK